MIDEELHNERWEAAVIRYFESILTTLLNPVCAQDMTIMLPPTLTSPPEAEL